jgi:hypothetical protein
MQVRCLQHCLGVLWTVLAIALVSFCFSGRAQSKKAISASSAQFMSDLSPAPADFDGDRVVDLMTLDRTGWQLSVEIHLSRTHEVSIIPVDWPLSVIGALTVRDLDSDGDTDLFWKGALPLAPPQVSVWFNDGTGRFAHLFSLHPLQSQPTPGRSFSKDSSRIGPSHEVLSSKRVPSPVSLSTTDWTRHGSPSEQRRPLTVVSFTLFFKRHPSDRGPPILL